MFVVLLMQVSKGVSTFNVGGEMMIVFGNVIQAVMIAVIRVEGVMWRS